DVNGASSTGVSTAIDVAATGDLTVGSVSPTSAGLNVGTTLSATYSGSATIASCGLFIDGSLAKNMTLSGSATNGTASATWTFTSTGTHTAQVRCTDVNGTTASGAITTLSVPGSIPSVGSVTPSSLTLNASSQLSASYNLSAAVSNCHLLVDGTDRG